MKKNIVQIIIIVALLGLIIAAQFAPHGTSRLFDMLKIGKKGTIKELRDFSIEDTARIDRIFLVDKENTIADLKQKEDNRWYINDKYLAKKHSVNVLLKTFHRMTIKNPVARSAEKNILKQLATKSVKVEVYDGDEILKTYYIGGVTQDQTGTYALLEGSQKPFVIEIPGFRGYLSSRFYTEEILWRTTRIFVYDETEIDEVAVEIRKKPQQSFKVKVKNAGNYELYNLEDKKAKVFDTLAVRRFIKEFKFKHASRYMTNITDNQRDSIYNSPYFYQIDVDLKNGVSQSITLHTIPDEQQFDYDKDPMYQTDYLYGAADKKTLVLIQTHIFAPLFKELDDFKPRF